MTILERFGSCRVHVFRSEFELYRSVRISEAVFLNECFSFELNAEFFSRCIHVTFVLSSFVRVSSTSGFVNQFFGNCETVEHSDSVR
jgi:hypothetical protein